MGKVSHRAVSTRFRAGSPGLRDVVWRRDTLSTVAGHMSVFDGGKSLRMEGMPRI